MKKSISIFLICLVSLIPLSGVSAESTFNPNFILSDEELQDDSTMSVSDIQAFLEDKGGYIATLKTENKDGIPLKASQIIYQAAKEHKINPKYLLVKLQKEQSLVTAKQPTQKQLDGATGYGISDGCGWSCATYLRNQGFGKQVSAAAGIMRWYYDNLDKQSFIKRAGQTYTISGQQVKPGSQATAFLYTYTPHIQGNENFWKLWQQWFEQVYPSGTLLRNVETGDVYLIQEGKKRHIQSVTALISRFDPKYIIDTSAAELSRYDMGAPISLPNYAILREESTYYLLDYDTLRPFKDKKTFEQFGYHPDEVIEITGDDLDGYKIGNMITGGDVDPFGRLIHVDAIDATYYIKNGVYHDIWDKQIAALAFPKLSITNGTLSDIEGLTHGDPILFPDGSLIGIEGSNKIYTIENGKKRHIANEDVFTGLGYKWENIVWTKQFMGIAHPTGQAVYLDRQIGQTNIIAQEPEQSEENIESQPEDDVMYRASNVEFSGPVFDTLVDTYLIADYTSGEILASKNADFKRPLASLTKVVTGDLLLEKNINLKQINTYDPAKHKAIYHRFRIAAGESVRNRDLLDAFLVSSLNTPGNMLVSSVSDRADFVDAMNAHATELGLTKTTFVSPTGEQIANQSTAREYLTLFTEALKDSTVLSYLGKKSYSYDEVLDLDDKPKHFDNHSNWLVNAPELGFTIEASKTGYLDEAGSNLAMLVTRPSDGKQFVIITMGNPDYTNRFSAPKALTQWAFNQF